jgi:hypothetical protein
MIKKSDGIAGRQSLIIIFVLWELPFFIACYTTMAQCVFMISLSIPFRVLILWG